jgi:hypothetical protein
MTEEVRRAPCPLPLALIKYFRVNKIWMFHGIIRFRNLKKISRSALASLPQSKIHGDASGSRLLSFIIILNVNGAISIKMPPFGGMRIYAIK